MQYNYLIELRISDTNKFKIKKNSSLLKKKYRLYNIEAVPHITLYGGFGLNPGVKKKELKFILKNIVQKHQEINYEIDGYDQKKLPNGKYVLAYKIIPSEDLLKIHMDILTEMTKISKSKRIWDSPSKMQWYHITIANPIDKKKVEDICGKKGFFGFLSTEGEKSFKLHAIVPRLTILHNRRILYEYDFKMNKWMNRRRALESSKKKGYNPYLTNHYPHYKIP